MALWSLRKTSLRKKTLQQMSWCTCFWLAAPCVYGMALVLLHVRWVCMLAVLVAYNIGTCTSTDQRCNSRPEEKAYRPLSPKSTIASKLKPWNISCVKGRQNKKLVRWMFCCMCRKVSEKNCIKEALQHSCSVLCQVVMCVFRLRFVCGRMFGNIIAQCVLWHFRCSGCSAEVTGNMGV